jgi:hypothetical protein
MLRSAHVLFTEDKTCCNCSSKSEEGGRMKFGIYGLGNYLLTMHMVRSLFEQVSFGLLVAWAKYERYIPVWEDLVL